MCSQFVYVAIRSGATLQPIEGADAGTVQTIGVRFANNELSLEANYGHVNLALVTLVTGCGSAKQYF